MPITLNGTTGITTPAITADTNTLYVDATNDRVGVGTTSPSTKLHVVGDVFVGNDSNVQWSAYSAGSSGVIVTGNATNNTLDTYTTGTLRTRIDSSGNFQFNSGYGSVATAYGCRAWVNFNGIGTVGIRASGNVSSITDNGTGDYTLNFTTALPDGNYAWSGFGINSAGTGPALITWTTSTGTQSTTQLRVKCVDSTAGNTFDSYSVSVSVFR